MLVVAVILIIASIALPRMSQARIRAKEAAAISSVRAIRSAQLLYSNTFPATGFASKLIYLGSNGTDCSSTSPTNACMIDSVLASGSKGDYNFDLQGDGSVPEGAYTLTAAPRPNADVPPCTYSTDQSGSIQLVTAQQSSGLSMGGGGGSGCIAP